MNPTRNGKIGRRPKVQGGRRPGAGNSTRFRQIQVNSGKFNQIAVKKIPRRKSRELGAGKRAERREGARAEGFKFFPSPHATTGWGGGKENDTFVSERHLATSAPGRHGNPLRLGTAALRRHNGLGFGRDATTSHSHQGVGRGGATGNERTRYRDHKRIRIQHHQQHQDAPLPSPCIRALPGAGL